MKVNAAGRWVPDEINDHPIIPYQGVGKHIPRGRKAAPPVVSCAHYPTDGNKVIPTLRQALKLAGLRDGMTISTHHHFRDGDKLTNQLFDLIADMGVKGGVVIHPVRVALPSRNEQHELSEDVPFSNAVSEVWRHG